MAVDRGLLGVGQFHVASTIVDETIAEVRAAARDGLEAMVVWAGRRSDAVVDVTRAIVPRQTRYQTDEGLLVLIDGDALFDLNRDLFQRGELLVAQVHSHGAGAFHSDTDDHLAVVTLLGGMSGVIPDFGLADHDPVRDWYWTRLVGTGTWSEIKARDVIRIV